MSAGTVTVQAHLDRLKEICLTQEIARQMVNRSESKASQGSGDGKNLRVPSTYQYTCVNIRHVRRHARLHTSWAEITCRQRGGRCIRSSFNEKGVWLVQTQ